MKAIALLGLGTLLIAGCAGQRVAHPLAREARRPGREPEIFRVEDKDVLMRHAVRDARRTVGVFIAAVKNPKPGQRDFEVKEPFVQDGDVEHLWLSDVEFSGNRFHGRVDNRPSKIKGLKFGARVSVKPDEISDWAFVENGRLVGGYTIRALYHNLPPGRKRDFEHEANFRIGKRSPALAGIAGRRHRDADVR